MRASALFTLLASSAGLVAAVPPAGAAKAAGLRLIKTSPEDKGTWVTEEQKITQYRNNRIGFVDITDITVSSIPRPQPQPTLNPGLC